MRLRQQEYPGSTRPKKAPNFRRRRPDDWTPTARWPPKDGRPTQTAQVLICALPESHGNELGGIHNQVDRRLDEDLAGIQECGA